MDMHIARRLQSMLAGFERLSNVHQTLCPNAQQLLRLEMEPMFTKSELMDLTGLSSSTIQNFTSDGLIERPERGKYATDSIKRIINHYETKSGTSAAQNGMTPRDRRDLAEAMRSELKLEHETGALMAAEDVISGWAEICAAIQAAMMVIPDRLAATQGLSSSQVTEIDKEIRAALELLSSGEGLENEALPKAISDLEGSSTDEASAASGSVELL